MKKILSMICAAVMLVSMFSFVASAAEAPIISFVDNGDGTIDIMLDTNGNDEVWALTANIDFSEAVTEGAAVAATGANGVTCKYVKAKKMVQVSYTDTNMASYLESGKVGTVTLTNWTQDFTVKAMASPASGGTDYTNGNFNTNIVETTFSLGGGEEDDVNVIVPSDVKSVTTDAAATDCQIGTGIGLTANAGEAVFTKMIWALTSGENKLFSKVIELPGISGEFKVAATFINGSHNEKFDVEVVESVAIDAVNAIFTDGTADYFTDATDAALKAE